VDITLPVITERFGGKDLWFARVMFQALLLAAAFGYMLSVPDCLEGWRGILMKSGCGTCANAKMVADVCGVASAGNNSGWT